MQLRVDFRRFVMTSFETFDILATAILKDDVIEIKAIGLATAVASLVPSRDVTYRLQVTGIFHLVTI